MNKLHLFFPSAMDWDDMFDEVLINLQHFQDYRGCFAIWSTEFLGVPEFRTWWTLDPCFFESPFAEKHCF